MYTALNVAGVTSLIGEYPTGTPAIWSDTLMTQEYTGDGINFYLDSGYDPRLDIDIYPYIINCRASTFSDSVTLGNAVLTAIHRKSFNDYYISCNDVLQTLPPVDETDDYNTIITATLKKR